MEAPAVLPVGDLELETAESTLGAWLLFLRTRRIERYPFFASDNILSSFRKVVRTTLIAVGELAKLTGGAMERPQLQALVAGESERCSLSRTTLDAQRCSNLR